MSNFAQALGLIIFTSRRSTPPLELRFFRYAHDLDADTGLSFFHGNRPSLIRAVAQEAVGGGRAPEHRRFRCAILALPCSRPWISHSINIWIPHAYRAAAAFLYGGVRWAHYDGHCHPRTPAVRRSLPSLCPRVCQHQRPLFSNIPTLTRHLAPIQNNSTWALKSIQRAAPAEPSLSTGVSCTKDETFFQPLMSSRQQLPSLSKTYRHVQALEPCRPSSKACRRGRVFPGAIACCRDGLAWRRQPCHLIFWVPFVIPNTCWVLKPTIVRGTTRASDTPCGTTPTSAATHIHSPGSSFPRAGLGSSTEDLIDGARRGKY